MNIHDLRAAQVHFESQIDDIIEIRQELYNLRDAFVRYYTPAHIRRMPLEHYALGKELPERGYNFCYTLERQLDGLGRILGATSFKFGVYFGRTRSDEVYKYRHTQKFGSNYTEAYENVKTAILDLLEAGENEDIDAIVNNLFSPMFKGKILSTYFPDRYLNVFSDDHLEYFLVQFNIDTEDLIWSDAVIKREALVEFKNQDDVMRKWSLDLFTYFLYNIYPGRPPREDEKPDPNDPLQDYRNPNFPSDPTPEWVDMAIQPPTEPKKRTPKGKGRSNPDYEKEAKKLKKLGDRGEKIVLDMERQRLMDLGREDLAEDVGKAEYDYIGYDIKSFEGNGNPRYIEVKTTSSKVGTANFFLSANELSKARELPNYHLYIVYDILSANPKVWGLPNPFHPENPNIVKTIISYRVVINAKKN